MTEPKYTGPKPPYQQLDEKGTYSWLKTPRWRGHAVEVGPLARMLVGYASGRNDFKEVVTEALGAAQGPRDRTLLDPGTHCGPRSGDTARRALADG